MSKLGALKSQLLSYWQRSIAPAPAQGDVLYDRVVLWLSLCLMVLGLVMVGSASIPEGLTNFDDSFHYPKRHAVYLVLACITLAVGVCIPIDWWQRNSSRILLVGIGLLVLVLLIGRNVNGSTRWIGVGPFNIQPAEVAKLSFLLFLSAYLVRRYEQLIDGIKGFFKPIAVLIVMCGLILLQPDMGSAMVMLVITFGVLFLAGAQLIQFFGMVFLGVIAVVLLIAAAPYRMRRVTSFFDPWSDPFGSGYQLTQSLMAFGRGSWFGEGLGNSIQKLEYLPEAHTDFVIAILAEELGFAGVLLVVGLIAVLVVRAMQIGMIALKAQRAFAGYLACGISIWFCFQSVVNIGAAAGMLPTKGLTLPLVSYGGSSLLVMTLAVAMLLRIDYENRLAKHQAFVKDPNEK